MANGPSNHKCLKMLSFVNLVKKKGTFDDPNLYIKNLRPICKNSWILAKTLKATFDSDTDILIFFFFQASLHLYLPPFTTTCYTFQYSLTQKYSSLLVYTFGCTQKIIGSPKQTQNFKNH